MQLWSHFSFLIKKKKNHKTFSSGTKPARGVWRVGGGAVLKPLSVCPPLPPKNVHPPREERFKIWVKNKTSTSEVPAGKGGSRNVVFLPAPRWDSESQGGGGSARGFLPSLSSDVT